MTSTLGYRLSVRLSAVVLILVCAAIPAACVGPDAGLSPSQVELGQIDPDGVSQAQITVPMVFPVLGKCSWEDTFLASRSGGTRRHLGQDLMAPKMCPMVAVFDGVAYPHASGGNNILSIVGDNGWTAVYMHINNDTPGTDDGLGSSRFAFASEITAGTRVSAGQMVAWVGDSGNAESTAPHLHFEMHSNSCYAAINPAPSLRAAQRLLSPAYRDSNGLTDGDIRVSGTVVEVDQAAMTVTLDTDAILLPHNQSIPLSPARRKVISLSVETQVHHSSDTTTRVSLSEVKEGAKAEAVGRNHGIGSTLVAERLTISAETKPEAQATPGGGSAQPVIETKPSDTVHAAAPAIPAPAPRLPTLAEQEQKGLVLLNADRASAGLPALRLDATLAAAARAHAQDMANENYMDHANKQGKGPSDRLHEAGIEWTSWAENIAINGNIEAVEESWMNSPGHHSNIMSPNNTHVGIGLARNATGQLYAVQLFAKARQCR